MRAAVKAAPVVKVARAAKAAPVVPAAVPAVKAALVRVARAVTNPAGAASGRPARHQTGRRE